MVESLMEVLEVYEQGLDDFLKLARQELNDPAFGSDLPQLAAMQAIPGLSLATQDELLHFARTVLKKRQALQELRSQL